METHRRQVASFLVSREKLNEMRKKRKKENILSPFSIVNFLFFTLFILHATETINLIRTASFSHFFYYLCIKMFWGKPLRMHKWIKGEKNERERERVTEKNGDKE